MKLNEELLKQLIDEEYESIISEAPGNYEQALKKFIDFGNKVSLDHYKTKFKKLYDIGAYELLDVKRGKKFDKIVRVRQEDKQVSSVYCFVDRATGDIYKAAGWAKPAKGARGSIFEPASYKRFDPYGSWLYKR